MYDLKSLLEELSINSAYVKCRLDDNDINIIKKYFKNPKAYEIKGLNDVIADIYNINKKMLAYNKPNEIGIHNLRGFIFNGKMKSHELENNDYELNKLENHYFFNSRSCNSMSLRSTGLSIPLAIYYYELKETSGILDLNDNSEGLPLDIYNFPTFNAVSAGGGGNHRMQGIALAYDLLKNCTLRAEIITVHNLENNDENFTEKAVDLIKKWELEEDLILNIQNGIYSFSKNKKCIKIELNEHPLNIEPIYSIMNNLSSWYDFLDKYNIDNIWIKSYKCEFIVHIGTKVIRTSQKGLEKIIMLPSFVKRMDKYYKNKSLFDLFKLMNKNRDYLNNAEEPRYILQAIDSDLFRNFSTLFWDRFFKEVRAKLY
jgi:hypothetical protein